MILWGGVQLPGADDLSKMEGGALHTSNFLRHVTFRFNSPRAETLVNVSLEDSTRYEFNHLSCQRNLSIWKCSCAHLASESEDIASNRLAC